MAYKPYKEPLFVKIGSVRYRVISESELESEDGINIINCGVFYKYDLEKKAYFEFAIELKETGIESPINNYYEERICLYCKKMIVRRNSSQDFHCNISCRERSDNLFPCYICRYKFYRKEAEPFCDRCYNYETCTLTEEGKKRMY